jgi:hypothetical protein
MSEVRGFQEPGCIQQPQASVPHILDFHLLPSSRNIGRRSQMSTSSPAHWNRDT